MVSGQETNTDNLGTFFFISFSIIVVCTHQNRLDEAILMSTHTILHDKIRKFP